jgi:hypothetical protein
VSGGINCHGVYANPDSTTVAQTTPFIYGHCPADVPMPVDIPVSKMLEATSAVTATEMPNFMSWPPKASSKEPSEFPVASLVVRMKSMLPISARECSHHRSSTNMLQQPCASLVASTGADDQVIPILSRLPARDVTTSC